MPVVLFVCTANQFRSPLAAAAFQKVINEMHPLGNWNIESAGSWVRQEASAHPLAIRYADEIGVDLRRHKSREVNSIILGRADLIIVMSRGQREAIQFEFIECRDRVHSLNDLIEDENYDIPDPAESGFAEAGPIWREIQKKVDLALPKIIQLAVENAAKDNIR